MHRVKKHMVSKLAELKIGRKIIQQYVGTEGNELVDALKNASTRHSSKDKAKSLKQLTYKMAFKVKFMVDRGEITESQAIPLVQALVALAVELQHTLKPQLKEDEPAVDAFVDKMVIVKDETVKLLSPYLSTKNNDALDNALCYYADRDFVTAVVTDQNFEAEKQTLFENVQVLMDLSDDPTSQLNSQVVKSIPLFSDKYSSVICAVQIFWRTVASKNKDELVHKLYQNLFKTNPEYASIFKNTVEEREQQLSKMINYIISQLQHFERLSEELRKLGHKHVAWGVPLEGFDQMWNALDAAQYELFGLKYKKQVRKSMALVFTQLTDIMKSCYPPEAKDDSKDDHGEAVKNVQEFWKDVQKERDQVSHSLYESLFSRHPEYESLFTGDVEELEDKVMNMFKRVVFGMDDLDKLTAEMASLGKMHLAMGVPCDAFGHMWNALDLTLLLIFGIQYNSGVRHTLSNVFQRLVIAMRESYPPEQR